MNGRYLCQKNITFNNMKFLTGNILESKAEALVNTVNIEGVMGKGIALQFKKAFPYNYKVYKKGCEEGDVKIGKLLVVKDKSLLDGEKIIINFPTKTTWRKPSEYIYIEEGLKDLKRIIEEHTFKSIAIPPLGAGQGGLNWEKVKSLLTKYLTDVDAEIIIYEPNSKIKEELKKERAKLTPARAMLLAMMYELVRNGEFVSEFAAEKIAYFLQKFGGEKVLKLDFKENFYGPYSGKVRHVLYYLNGSYIMGFSSMDKKPFETLELIMDGEKDVQDYLNLPENEEFIQIINKTKSFLKGYYSNLALELLSTVDYVNQKFKLQNESEIREKIENWSDRKKNLFANPNFITKAYHRLQTL
jgi:O-acetyl-ADP-ribose deacetylase (regulator of RNase III)